MSDETDQSILWSTPTLETGFKDIWEKNEYFSLPTSEVANWNKLNMTETANKISLYPN